MVPFHSTPSLLPCVHLSLTCSSLQHLLLTSLLCLISKHACHFIPASHFNTCFSLQNLLVTSLLLLTSSCVSFQHLLVTSTPASHFNTYSSLQHLLLTSTTTASHFTPASHFNTWPLISHLVPQFTPAHHLTPPPYLFLILQ
ncbi:hypothetical protein Pcinc_016221 [Petrolisthes cinctipes]|uniref:Uncharacterized protein n=1 Tax=Petrolisthes cinctipes TaxID=88211 RepID=A0AAE1FSQ9_PETCI|nr:hypothetical protein Pcinc_016221 [Petrolisthes cinctipes]